MQRRHLLGAGAAAILPGFGTLLWSGAAAGAAPLETVKVLCGYPAGGTTDAVARRVADKLRGGYAKSTLVDNKAGASGRLAIEELKRSPADGSVLLVTPASSISLFPHIYNKLSYKIEDLAPVSTACRITFGFAVGPAVPASVKNLKDFVSWAKAQPGQVNFASGGNGTSTHLNGELMNQVTGLDMTHVPYKGSAPAVQDLLGGQTQILIDAGTVLLPQIKGGKLQALAVTGPKRDPQLPDVPTVAELGLGGMESVGFQGLVGPAGMPKDVVDRLAAELTKALGQPDIKAKFATAGAEVHPLGPTEFAAFVKKDNEKWAKLIKERKLQLD